ncbi:MAG TPA: sugar ABC transporter ATP-binding protein [Thermoleophilaceae bacterium]
MLEAQGIRKAYGGVVALAGADLTVRAGTVHAVLGENGAGKSTLVKIVAGAVPPDAGVLRLDGRPVSFANTVEAVRHGVAVVSQELNLFPDLDVLANLFPMREVKRGPFVSRKAMAERAQPILDQLGLEVSMRQPLGSLSLAERQLVEIAKALLTDPRVLILDEPTSALEASSTEALLGIVRVLREREVAVVFVSHILEEAMQVADEVTVLRDGKLVLSGVPRSELSMGSLVEAMVGKGHESAAPSLDLERTVTAEDASGLALRNVATDRLRNVTLNAPPGEIVGLAGVAGSGHLAVLELVAGLRRPRSGEVLLPGGRPAPRGLRNAIRAGVALVTGDRRRLGLLLDKTVWENVGQVRAVGLAREGWVVRKGNLRERAREHVRNLHVRTPSVDEPAGRLSGGNQQKLVFAKWLDAEPGVLLLDDPTRGVDVRAKAEMHGLIRSAARAGGVVLLCSTDVAELAELCDRVAVFYQGGICAELSGDGLSEGAILEAMNTGGVSAAA